MRATNALGTISAPKDLEEKGFAADVVADKLRAAVKNVFEAAHSVKTGAALEKHPELPDIVVSRTGLPAEIVASQIRKLFRVSNRWQVGDRVTEESGTYSLDLRIADDKGSRVTPIGPPTKDFGQLMDRAAHEALKAADSYLLAASYKHLEPKVLWRKNSRLRESQRHPIREMTPTKERLPNCRTERTIRFVRLF